MSFTGSVVAAAERRPTVLVGLGVVVYALGPVLISGAEIGGTVLLFWRLWMGTAVFGVVTLGYVRATGRRPDRQGWTWAVGCGLVFSLHQLAFVTALKRTSVVDVTLMQVLQPLIVAVLAAPLFGERPGPRFRIWSAVAMAGAAAVALGGASGPEGDGVGMALAALNILVFAVYFVGSKHVRDKIDVIPFLWAMTGTAAVVISAVVAATTAPVGDVGGPDLLACLTIAVLPGFLGHFLSTWPLRWVPANVPPLLQLGIPFIAGTLAWAVLDQGITVLHLAGGAVTVIGAAAALRSPSGRQLVEEEDAVLATGGG